MHWTTIAEVMQLWSREIDSVERQRGMRIMCEVQRSENGG